MKVLDAEFVKGFMRMADDGWLQGWHERNGGNLSYRIKAEEVESVKEELKPGEWRRICLQKWGESSTIITRIPDLKSTVSSAGGERVRWWR